MKQHKTLSGKRASRFASAGRSKYLVCCALSLLLSSALQAQTKDKTRILFIFDASGSMTQTYSGNSSRMAAAKKILVKMVDSLSHFSNVEVALRVYGHQHTVLEKDCRDSKLEIPFSKANHAIIKKKVIGLQPKGYTPIAYSLEQSANDFPAEPNVRNIIILITDGLEECTGDPCAISQALQKKGIFLKPFIIGVGSDPEKFRYFFSCVGTYYDANNETESNLVTGVVISQAMNATSCQVNLLDQQLRPLETNVAMTIYDAASKQLLHNFDHTLNGRGVPDTLFLDPMRRYDIVVHTMPEVRKNGIELVAGRHNLIAIDVPQGNIELISKGVTNYPRLQAVIRQHGQTKTINAQEFNTTKRYLTGSYDMEILTVPRIYLEDVRVKQNETYKITIPQPGKLSFTRSRDFVVAIYQMKNGQTEWVADLDDKVTSQVMVMQPGKYFLIARSKAETRTIYTFQKEFIITSGTVTELSI